jgi:hypothetical protein
VVETGEAVEVEISGVPPAAPGERHHWMVAIHPVRDASGAVAGVSATVTDITERVAAERRLAFLARAGEVLGRTLDFDTTLRGVASLAVPELADWCVIDLLEAGGAVRRVAVAHADPASGSAGTCRSATRRASTRPAGWPRCSACASRTS